jgi:argininosuccinate lyase
MPQKKNPDCLEIIKGKAALTQGRLVSLLSLAQSSFMGYNRESQLGKCVIMDMVADALPCIGIMRGIVKTLKVNSKRMLELCAQGFIHATSLTEYLCAEKGLPFRLAKELVECAVRHSEEQGDQSVTQEALTAACKQLKVTLEVTAADVAAAQDPKSILTKRLSLGGPSMAAMRRDTRLLASQFQSHRRWLEETRTRIEKGLQRLHDAEKKILG